jgi:membrane protein implicated in regulation of membrane protease activity
MDGLVDIELHYTWLAIGLVLAIAEMAIPGVFLIWMAGAALITGLVAWLFPIGLPIQIVIFAVLSILAVFTGKRMLKDHPVVAADPKMNQRGERVIGETVVVTQAIEGGSGRVKLGDGEWLARGADAVVGTRLRVVGHDGVVLIVEPVA